MRLPFLSSSPAHEIPAKDRKKKTKKNKGKAVEVEILSCSPTTVLSMEAAGWASSSSAASTPSSSLSSSSSSSSAAAQDHSVSSKAEAPLPFPASRQQPSSGITKEDLVVVLRRLDENADDAITAESDLDAEAVSEEDLRMLLAQLPQEDELLAAFGVFDADGDGKITAEELRGVLAMLGDDGCSVDDCRRMIVEIDSVGNGCVCFPDFARMMLTAVDVQ